MTCGNKYAHLLVTEDGMTPDDPWEWFAGPMDYDEWYDVSHRVAREVYRRWNWMLAIEDKLSKLDDPQPSEVYPERDLLLEQLLAFQASLEQLGHVAIEPVKHPDWTWEPSIRRAIAAGRDGTCLIEELDKATIYYQRPPLPESQPPRQPKTGKTTGSDNEPQGGLGPVLVTGALAAGGFWWWRHNKKKQAIT